MIDLQKFIVPKGVDDQSVAKAIKNIFPAVKAGALKQAVETRDIRINGDKMQKDQRVFEGDELTVYLSDEQLFGTLKIIFEDKNVLIVHKEAGVSVEDANRQNTDTLFKRAQRHVGEGFLKPCHRLDHHTEGLVCFAKTEEAYEAILEAFKNGKVRKQYVCLVGGCPVKKEQTLRGYGVKDAQKSLMRLSSKNERNAVEMVTRYQVVTSCGDLSLLEVEILTGRTHQIRVQLSGMGHPILGDDKYGDYALNKKWGASHQALLSYRLTLKPEGEAYAYLAQKTFEIPIDFKLPLAERKLKL